MTTTARDDAFTYHCGVMGSRTRCARVMRQILQYMDKKPQLGVHRSTRVSKRVCFEMSRVYTKDSLYPKAEIGVQGSNQPMGAGREESEGFWDSWSQSLEGIAAQYYAYDEFQRGEGLFVLHRCVRAARYMGRCWPSLMGFSGFW